MSIVIKRFLWVGLSVCFLFSCGKNPTTTTSLTAPISKTFDMVVSGFGDSTTGSSLPISDASKIFIQDEQREILRVPKRPTLQLISTYPLNPATVTAQNILIVNTVSHTEIEPEVSVSSDGRHLSITPTQDLESNVIYAITVTQRVTAIDGTPLQAPIEFFVKPFGPLARIKLATTLPLMESQDPKVVINEVVVDPKKEWGETSGGSGIPFDRIPGTTPSAKDQWVELYNAGSNVVNLKDASLRYRAIGEAGTGILLCTLGSLTASDRCIERYKLSGDSTSFKGGDFLVLGGFGTRSPIPLQNVEILLVSEADTVLDTLQINEGASQSVETQAIVRKTNGVSKNAQDFKRASATIGEASSDVEGIIAGSSVFMEVIGEDQEGYRVPVGDVSFSNFTAEELDFEHLGNHLYMVQVKKIGNGSVTAKSGALETQASYVTLRGSLSPFKLIADPSQLESDGKAVATIQSEVIKNEKGVAVGAGQFFTVSSSLGEVIANDQDAVKVGVQIASSAASILTFQVKSDYNYEAKNGRNSTIKAISHDGPEIATNILFTATHDPIASGDITFSQVQDPKINIGQERTIQSDVIKDERDITVPDTTMFDIESPNAVLDLSKNQDLDATKAGMQMTSSGGILNIQLKATNRSTLGSIVIRPQRGGESFGLLTFQIQDPAVAGGAPAGTVTFNMDEANRTLVGDGGSTLTLTSSPLKDSNQDNVGSDKQVDVYDSSGKLFLPLSQDVNADRQGIQVKTAADGTITVQVRSTRIGERTEAEVRLSSVPGQGTVSGQIIFILVPQQVAQGGNNGGAAIQACQDFEKLPLPGTPVHYWNDVLCTDDPQGIFLVAKNKVVPQGCLSRFNSITAALAAVPNVLTREWVIEVQDNEDYSRNSEGFGELGVYIAKITNPDKRLIIRARPGFSPKITNSSSWRNRGLSINASNVVIHGFTIEKVYYGVFIGDNISNVKIQNNSFRTLGVNDAIITGVITNNAFDYSVNGEGTQILNNCFDGTLRGVEMGNYGSGKKIFQKNVFKDITWALWLGYSGSRDTNMEYYVTDNVVLSFVSGGGNFYFDNRFGPSSNTRQQLIEKVKSKLKVSDRNIIHYALTPSTQEIADKVFVHSLDGVTNSFDMDEWVQEVGLDVNSQFIQR